MSVRTLAKTAFLFGVMVTLVQAFTKRRPVALPEFRRPAGDRALTG